MTCPCNNSKYNEARDYASVVEFQEYAVIENMSSQQQDYQEQQKLLRQNQRRKHRDVPHEHSLRHSWITSLTDKTIQPVTGIELTVDHSEHEVKNQLLTIKHENRVLEQSHCLLPDSMIFDSTDRFVGSSPTTSSEVFVMCETSINSNKFDQNNGYDIEDEFSQSQGLYPEMIDYNKQQQIKMGGENGNQTVVSSVSFTSYEEKGKEEDANQCVDVCNCTTLETSWAKEYDDFCMLAPALVGDPRRSNQSVKACSIKNDEKSEKILSFLSLSSNYDRINKDVILKHINIDTTTRGRTTTMASVTISSTNSSNDKAPRFSSIVHDSVWGITTATFDEDDF